MVRRSSSAFFSLSSHSPSDESRPPSLPVTPNSPNFLDPFGSSIALPEPTRRVSTTTLKPPPEILIASPSTSTIHYLFPIDPPKSDNHLSVSGIGQDSSIRRKLSSSSTFTGTGTSLKNRSLRSRGNQIRVEGFLQSMSSQMERAESMRTLRRQPSMADLGSNRNKLKVNTRLPLREVNVGNMGETKLLDGKETVTREVFSCPKSLEQVNGRYSMEVPPRLAPEPLLPQDSSPSQDPLEANQITESPSYSHLDYAPTAPISTSQECSRHTRGWSIHQKAIFPTSAAMLRSTRAREESARRVKEPPTPEDYSFSGHQSKNGRATRSQSLSSKSTSTRSRWNRDEPLWDPHLSSLARKRRESSVYSPTYTYSDLDSPCPYSTNTNSPKLSPYSHPATLSTSDVSILAPTTVGLGFSPISSPATLPESLKAEAIDLTKAVPLSPGSEVPSVPERSTSPEEITLSPQVEKTPDAIDIIIAGGALTPPENSSNSRRSLVRENTYYLPGHPRPLRTVQSIDILSGSSTSPRTPEISTPTPSIVRSLSMRFRFPQRPPSHTAPPLDVATLPIKQNRHLSILCSPVDAIDPLPPASSNHRKSFVSTTSTSLRGIGKTISRSLSQAFDTRDHAKLEAKRLELNEKKSRISHPLEAIPRGNENREFREDLLSQAVSLSIGSKLSEYTQVSFDSHSNKVPARPGIPQILLESAPIIENPKYSTLRGLRRSIRKAKEGDSNTASGPMAKVSQESFVHVTPPSPEGNDAIPVDNSSYQFHDSMEISHWSPSPEKPKRKLRLMGIKRSISPPPKFNSRSISNSIPQAETNTLPHRSLSRSKSFFKHLNSSNTSLHGISSKDDPPVPLPYVPPSPPVLEKLSESNLSRFDKDQQQISVAAWRDDVRETVEALRLEGQILRHLELEVETRKELKRRSLRGLKTGES